MISAIFDPMIHMAYGMLKLANKSWVSTLAPWIYENKYIYLYFVIFIKSEIMKIIQAHFSLGDENVLTLKNQNHGRCWIFHDQLYRL